MKGRHRIAIDVDITPLYCSICENQLPHLYKHAGSRYDYVGEVECDFCGGGIGCVDSDNIVEYLHLVKENNSKWDVSSLSRKHRCAERSSTNVRDC